MKRLSVFLGDDKPRLILPLSSSERVLNLVLIVLGQWALAASAAWVFYRWYTHPV